MKITCPYCNFFQVDALSPVYLIARSVSFPERCPPKRECTSLGGWLVLICPRYWSGIVNHIQFLVFPTLVGLAIEGVCVCLILVWKLN